MKEMLALYARYNAWANKRIIDTMLALPIRSMTIESEGSFPSLRDTALHIWSAEYMWLQRLKHIPDPIRVQDLFVGVNRELCNNWQRTSQDIMVYVEAVDDETLKKTISFNDRQGNPYTLAVHDILHHVFNHSTFHRGQLVNQLRFAGATEIPWTDLSAYVAMNRSR